MNNPVYWDDELKQFYWIEWCDTGNSEIPTRHYIKILLTTEVEDD